MPNVPAKRSPGDGAIVPRRLPKVGPYDMYEALLVDSACANTMRSRVDVIKALCKFLGEPDPSAACALLITGDRSQATAVVSSFRQHLIQAHRSGATINNRLAGLRRLIELANRHDLITWRFTVEDLKVTPYRDTKGPSMDQWRRLWAAAVEAKGPFAARNRAIIRLLRDVGLRKAECIGLDVADLDLAGARVAIVGKGRGAEKQWVTISPKCVELLEAWLAQRGTEAGPVFISRPERVVFNAQRDELGDRVTELRARRWSYAEIARLFNSEGSTAPYGHPWNGHKIKTIFSRRERVWAGGRLPDREVGRIIYALAEAAGLGRTIRPHGLRHHAVTRILDLTGGNIRMAQRLGRHKSADVTVLYDDNRQDLAGQCVRLLGADD